MVDDIVNVIREITREADLRNSVNVIRNAFETVAAEFKLTPENCPTSPAFVTTEQLRALRDKGVKPFGLFHDDVQLGFVAVERADGAVYYLEKLAVLPGYRHRGYGKKLIAFVCNYVKKNKCEKISLGMINESTILKDWYKKLGFQETGTKKFEHLPFTVCFMEKNLLPFGTTGVGAN